MRDEKRGKDHNFNGDVKFFCFYNQPCSNSALVSSCCQYLPWPVNLNDA